MKRLFIFIFLLLLLCFCFSITNAQTAKRTEIGFRVLDIEKKEGFNVIESNYLLLDSILADAEDIIEVKDSYTEEEAKIILGKIGDLINRYSNDYELEEYFLFSTSLSKRIKDCYSNVITYLTIAQRMDLPLFAIIAPKHITLLWKNEADSVYWETLSNTETSKDKLIMEHNIAMVSIERGTYLKPLPLDIFQGCIYSKMGDIHFEKSKLEFQDNIKKTRLKQAIKCYIISLNYNNFDADTYGNLGAAFSNMEPFPFDTVKKYYDSALYYNPNSAETSANRGIIFEVNADKLYSSGQLQNAKFYYELAINDYKRFIELAPFNPYLAQDIWRFQSDINILQTKINNIK
jgi:tetratricopeptide (TPR) repeat protein